MDEQTLRTTYARLNDHASYWVLRALRDGQTVEVEGIPVRRVGESEDLSPGDLYVGARNTANLLTVKSVGHLGCVWPEEPKYPFDLGECIKVEAVL